ncbi:early nodulin-93 [Cajanus cajan]|uniref:Early nodulin-93 n=1 Tax=Cajanus cajan TaxID=3821 RepID=A0A151R9X5_CAJCA|nr:early nodulin-93 [Cajanus cajan]KYP39351.1 Early nodulin-93 [Cajanus cajan]
MGIPSELGDKMLVSNKRGFLIASPAEDRKILRTKQCTSEGVRAGFKAASIAFVASAVPTLAAVRMVPWAKANLNYTAQALIISAASIASYFITADKTILECARKNAQLEDALRHNQ